MLSRAKNGERANSGGKSGAARSTNPQIPIYTTPSIFKEIG